MKIILKIRVNIKDQNEKILKVRVFPFRTTLHILINCSDCDCRDTFCTEILLLFVETYIAYQT